MYLCMRRIVGAEAALFSAGCKSAAMELRWSAQAGVGRAARQSQKQQLRAQPRCSAVAKKYLFLRPAVMPRAARLPAAAPSLAAFQHRRTLCRPACVGTVDSALATGGAMTEQTSAAHAVYQLVTFYCFSPIDDPNAEVKKHLAFCEVRA